MTTVRTIDPEEAATFIRAGDVVAFPTETVYGLGADVTRAKAIAKIFAAKERPADNPLIAHIADTDQLEKLVSKLTPDAERLLDAFFPGPLTLVLPKLDSIPSIATGGLDTIGVRMPAHPLAQALIRASGTPLVAPSANRSGRPSPTTWSAVAEDLDGRIACILQGDPSHEGLESTVVDCTGDAPLVLRPGMITLEALQRVVPSTTAASANTPAHRRSPGTRYRHYAPQAQVILVESADIAPHSNHCAFLGIDSPVTQKAWLHHQVFADEAAYARALYAAFRQCDALGIEIIYCQKVSRIGLGVALMDRLERAARD